MLSPVKYEMSSDEEDETDNLTELSSRLYHHRKHRKSLSQRSLDDMSLLYTATAPPIKEEILTEEEIKAPSPVKALSDDSFLKQPPQPRLSTFFQDTHEEEGSIATSSTKSKLYKVVSLPNYCFLCGYGGNLDNPLLNPCECQVQVHTDCLLQHIKILKVITCSKCDVPYNIRFGRMHPIWKWHCPYDRKWLKLISHLFGWTVLITCVTLLLIGPTFQIIKLNEIAKIVMSIMLLILLGWSIYLIVRTGCKSVCWFCEAFCLTNYDVSVGARLKGSPEDTKTRLLYMLCSSRKKKNVEMSTTSHV